MTLKGFLTESQLELKNPTNLVNSVTNEKIDLDVTI